MSYTEHHQNTTTDPVKLLAMKHVERLTRKVTTLISDYISDTHEEHNQSFIFNVLTNVLGNTGASIARTIADIKLRNEYIDKVFPAAIRMGFKNLPEEKANGK